MKRKEEKERREKERRFKSLSVNIEAELAKKNFVN